MRLEVFLLFGILSLPAWATLDFDRQQIEQRIQPVGRVHVEDQPGTSQPKQPVKAVAVKKEPGQETYDQFCVTCHRDGVAGAPRFRDKADWQPRLTANNNVDGLVASAIKGMNAMPPKGTCMDCSEKDLKQAIEYMLPKS
ncbi:c-type cytochrome [Legionella spiritensis]|uniref:Cytochrome c5 n=1 Tax=Legionella spiritensis TaxID=452 RepID=A0A0W0Z5I9_LEGSP|nr:c-type cytochrome [Legionella spiritensis]KTD64353.1 cytochrome c5 [Legionella spiritensis]SNV46374.1 cytochrome c5 [Legionella spiritensis]VEG91082.1 cytochrome c5 [Legionella spiritensis]